VAAQDLISNFKVTGTNLTDSSILGNAKPTNTSTGSLATKAQKDIDDFLSAGDPQKMYAAAERFSNWAKAAKFSQQQVVEALAASGLNQQQVSIDTGVSGAQLSKWWTAGAALATKIGDTGGTQVGQAIVASLQRELQSDKRSRPPPLRPTSSSPR
jgi:hypothetical protein